MVPKLIADAGESTRQRFVEFFVATIRNGNTREAYARAVCSFLAWCESRGVCELSRITPVAVAAYVEALAAVRAAPTVKQHLAAIRMLFDWLVTGHIVGVNPAWSVRGPKHVVKEGLTAVLTRDETRTLLDSIDTATIAGLRDRALIGVMVFAFGRVSAAVSMRVEDYFPRGRCWRIRLHEKGGKVHPVSCHHLLEEYLDTYLVCAAIQDEKNSPLFRTLDRAGQLTRRAMSRHDAFRMVRRRATAAGLCQPICCHSFRATGITEYMRNGGTLEKAAAVAAHESTRTTQLYNRANDEVSLDEIERIII